MTQNAVHSIKLSSLSTNALHNISSADPYLLSLSKKLTLSQNYCCLHHLIMFQYNLLRFFVAGLSYFKIGSLCLEGSRICSPTSGLPIFQPTVDSSNGILPDSRAMEPSSENHVADHSASRSKNIERISTTGSLNEKERFDNNVSSLPTLETGTAPIENEPLLDLFSGPLTLQGDIQDLTSLNEQNFGGMQSDTEDLAMVIEESLSREFVPSNYVEHGSVSNTLDTENASAVSNILVASDLRGKKRTLKNSSKKGKRKSNRCATQPLLREEEDALQMEIYSHTDTSDDSDSSSGSPVFKSSNGRSRSAVDDGPSAPDLQLDWMSSDSESDSDSVILMPDPQSDRPVSVVDLTHESGDELHSHNQEGLLQSLPNDHVPPLQQEIPLENSQESGSLFSRENDPSAARSEVYVDPSEMLDPSEPTTESSNEDYYTAGLNTRRMQEFAAINGNSSILQADSLRGLRHPVSSAFCPCSGPNYCSNCRAHSAAVVQPHSSPSLQATSSRSSSDADPPLRIDDSTRPSDSSGVLQDALSRAFRVNRTQPRDRLHLRSTLDSTLREYLSSGAPRPRQSALERVFNPSRNSRHAQHARRFTSFHRLPNHHQQLWLSQQRTAEMNRRRMDPFCNWDEDQWMRPQRRTEGRSSHVSRMTDERNSQLPRANRQRSNWTDPSGESAE